MTIERRFYQSPAQEIVEKLGQTAKDLILTAYREAGTAKSEEGGLK